MRPAAVGAERTTPDERYLSRNEFLVRERPDSVIGMLNEELTNFHIGLELMVREHQHELWGERHRYLNVVLHQPRTAVKRWHGVCLWVVPRAGRIRGDEAGWIVRDHDRQVHLEIQRRFALKAHRKEELMSVLKQSPGLQRRVWICTHRLFHCNHLIVHLLLRLSPVFAGLVCSGMHSCREQAERRAINIAQRFPLTDSVAHSNEFTLKLSERVFDDQISLAIRHLDRVSVGSGEGLLWRPAKGVSSILGNSPDKGALARRHNRIAPRFQVAVRNEMLFLLLSHSK